MAQVIKDIVTWLKQWFYDKTDVDTALSSKLDKASSDTGFVKSNGTIVGFGTTGTTVCAGNDSRLSNSRVPAFTLIPATSSNEVSLNTYRTGGFYYINSDSNAKYIDKCPTAKASNTSFFLLVETWGASSNNYVKQTLTYYNTNKTYVRTKAGNTDADTGWKDWVELSKDTNTIYTADESTITKSNSNQFSVKDGGITSDKIASMAITSGKIGPKEIQFAHINDGAIISMKIADGAVTNVKLADPANNLTEYIVGNHSTTATSTWTGISTKISSLTAGQVIYYKMTSAGTSAAVTLNLTLADGTTTGAKNVYYNGSTALTTHFPINSVLCLVYDGTKWIATAIQNTNSYDRLVSIGRVVNGESSTIPSGSIICGKSDKKYYRVAANVVFDIRYPLFWLSGNLTSGQETGSVYLFYAWVNLQSTVSGKTVTNLQEVFIEGTAFSNGQFTISSNVFVSDGSLTSGRYYIPIGQAYSTTNIGFNGNINQVFYYNGTNLIPVEDSKYATTGHTHGNITNAGAIGSTANLPIITTTNGKLTTGSFGTAANTFCQGNDSRLSNARTPTAHTDNDGAYGKATTSVWGHTKLGTTSDTAAAGNHNHDSTYLKINSTQIATASSSATQDLNDYTTNGLYYYGGNNASLAYVTNHPTQTGNYFVLRVERYNTNNLKQTLTIFSTRETYIRIKFEGNWKAWQKVTTTAV